MVNPLLEDERIDNLKRMEIVATFPLTEGHGLISHIREHTTCLTKYERKRRNLEIANAIWQGLNGAYHLQFFALRLSKYWQAHRRLPSQVMLGDPHDLIDMIELGKRWDPVVYHILEVF